MVIMKHIKTKMIYKKFLQQCIDNLEKMNNQQILSGLGELLNPKQKSWVKDNLKNEVIFLLKITLSQ